MSRSRQIFSFINMEHRSKILRINRFRKSRDNEVRSFIYVICDLEERSQVISRLKCCIGIIKSSSRETVMTVTRNIFLSDLRLAKKNFRASLRVVIKYNFSLELRSFIYHWYEHMPSQEQGLVETSYSRKYEFLVNSSTSVYSLCMDIELLRRLCFHTIKVKI